MFRDISVIEKFWIEIIFSPTYFIIHNFWFLLYSRSILLNANFD